ncbi:TonB-dependent receptor [Novosphingobium sp. G106]|uniref:TonB-dependent receptor n=1 Tax=Novosphingobium sp. G106 TaxID=2849500 RepID=UPI001C2DDA06|nr:TonB-dependent receptor [Novosphingobium sp. G106]MBV1686853.1 TonB-dependent receptor [Novosphingobium sp. G106]
MTNSFRATLLAATVLGATTATPAWAQSADENSSNDIIVTAQRVEQRLQDVPISITVLDQGKLANNNISNLKDVANLTPGFAVNSRYGADNTTFTIRGFYQEQRSFATVGVFFNDVVAPRGSGATFGGDGAGPGALFDLQNVQVLKGPQGTLFGRNVTGGAVLLVPRKPTDKLEGYVEGSAGDYNMWRLQGVINLPVSDTFKLRLGVDHMDREGYLKNLGRFGDGKFAGRGMGDVNYWAGRVSALWDVTPDLENYTVGTYTHSQSNGVIPKVTAAFPCAQGVTAPCPTSSNQAFFGNESVAQIAREASAGFWSVSNRLPDSQSISDQFQIINTLTWTASDSLTVKNILSYGEFKGKTNLDLFGNYSLLPGVVPGTETGLQVRGFAFTHNNGLTGYTNAERSMVGELQFQGHPGDGTFTWQAGGYAEINDPLGFSGVQTASFTACTDVPSFACLPSSAVGGPAFPAGTGQGTISGGTGSYSLQKTKFRDYALYAQASYKLTDQLTLTGGIRYTWDKMHTFLINETAVFQTVPSNVRFGCTNPTAPGYTGIPSPANPATFPYTFAQTLNNCQQNLEKNTSAPTWLLQADYKPIDNVMVYGKWSRGYRQGGIAIFGPDPLQKYDKETVDTFEAGAKTSWRGALPGSFNVSGYYNNLRNQQLQLGVACNPAKPLPPGQTTFVNCSGNATIINAGKSRIWGIEADLNVMPFDGLRLDLAYGYINAKLLKIVIPTVPAPYNDITPSLTQPCGGEQCNTIANSGPPHQVVAGGNYTLPFPESIGKFSVGATFVYQSRRRIVADGVVNRTNPALPITSGSGVAPSSSVLNLNATWENVGGHPFDLSFFMTNVTNEHVILQINDNTARGFISSIVGEPRMFGFRAKVRFGAE